MHEDEFSDPYRAAVGAPPDEPGTVQRAAAVLPSAPAREERSGAPRAMVLVAGALALLVLAGLLGPRLLRAAPRGTSPAGSARSSAAGAGSLATCRLPLIVTDGHASAAAPPADPMKNYPTTQDQYTAGFVAPATGRFVADPAAKAGSMPFSRMYLNEQWRPESYDPVLKRWLAAGVRQVSPDHRSYLYVVQSPLAAGKGATFDSSTLHVYDVTTSQDRALWTSPDQIGPDATWESDGIHASTVPFGGGRPSYWLVDPATGARTPVSPPASMGLDIRGYGMKGGGGFGTDGAGHPILLDGSRDAGARQEYFVGGPDGQRIVIHDGAMGDAFDFDPDGFTVDGDRLWAANYDATALWLWTAKDGLNRYPLTGVAQHDRYVSPSVVGPCS